MKNEQDGNPKVASGMTDGLSLSLTIEELEPIAAPGWMNSNETLIIDLEEE